MVAAVLAPTSLHLGSHVFYSITKRNPCHPVAAQSFHEKNVLQDVESIGNVFFDGVMFLSIPGKSFMQNWKQIRQWVELQCDGVARNKKLGDCNPE